MLHTILISDNPLNSGAWERFDVENVNEFLQERYPVWPETGRVYEKDVSFKTDVTPRDEESALYLETIEDPIWVAIYPGTGLEIATGVLFVASIALSVSAILLIPDPPNIETSRDRAVRSGSPNNSVTGRTNQARLEGRIPDIYGRVKSVPDLIQVPIVTWENNRELETSYMCVGKGEYDIIPEQILDGDTPVSQIPENSVHVYSPGDAPVGAGPHTGTQVAIGPAINDPVMNVFPVSSFNGQELIPFNANTIYGMTKKPGSNTSNAAPFPEFGEEGFDFVHFRFETATTGTFFVPIGKGREFVTDKIAVGDKLWFDFVVGLMPPSTQPAPDLNSTFTAPLEPDEEFPNSFIITAINPTTVVTSQTSYVQFSVDVPVALQAQWALLPAYADGLTFVDPFAQDSQLNGAGFGQEAISCIEAFLTPLTKLFLGPFLYDNSGEALGSGNRSVFVNVVGLNGLTTSDNVNIVPLSIDIGVRITPADINGNPTGPSVSQVATIQGSQVSPSSTRGITIRADISSFDPGQSFLISVQRQTQRTRTVEVRRSRELALFGGQRAFVGNIQDEVIVTHVYVTTTPPNQSFGDITTVQSRVVATVGRTAQKPKELNMTVFRLIDTWNGTAFTGPPVANDDVENVMFSIMKDSFIGNLEDEVIDFEQIADEAQKVRDYFDRPTIDVNPAGATQVSYTFDQVATSFEESLVLLANLAFCQVYRQADVFRMIAEIENVDSENVFNHRNIVPGSQTITHSFGDRTENDSVEVDWTDPRTGRTQTVLVPTNADPSLPNGGLVSPVNVRVPGLSTETMAFTHAWRAYQKTQFQRQALEMTNTAEAGELIVKSRVLVADTTQDDFQSGEVLEVSGVQLKVSQKPDFLGGGTFTIFLQNSDGTTEALVANPGTGGFDIDLGSLPSSPIRTDPNLTTVRTLYNLVRDQDAMPSAYLVSERVSKSNHEFQVSCINYTDIYYMADALNLWISTDARDSSPRQVQLEAGGIIPTVVDPSRGRMLFLDGSRVIGSSDVPFDVNNQNGDWTYSVWYRPAVNNINHRFVGTEPVTGTVFFEMETNRLVLGIDNTLVLSGPNNLNAGQLYHFGATFEIATGTARLFVDGEVVAETTGLSGPSSTDRHEYVVSCQGNLSELMHHRRAYSAQAMRDLFRKTLILTPP